VATLIPAYSTCAGRMTAGERRFAQRLQALLEDDYLCWYNVPIGARHRHPDFIVLHPRRGLLVLEVKDWKLDSIRRIDPQSVALLTDQGLKHKSNPIAQARQYMFLLKEILEQDPALKAPEGHPYAGGLVCPLGYGVVLTDITRKQFDSTDLAAALPPHLVICKDEMTEKTDAEAFQSRLWQMFTVKFQHVLTVPEIDRIRWHLFPEIRINQGSLLPVEEQNTAENVQDTLLRVMDLQQEQLARSLGEGHRVIHGVAGSGKTLILGYRCAHLAKIVTKPILVLCFNITLAARLRHMIAGHGLTERVTVQHFHGWCAEQLRTYHVPPPAEGSSDYYDELVAAVTRAVERGQIPRGQYSAVMIDEGHDFAPEWLKLVVQMVDPETNSLLLLYDDAQSIYKKKRSRSFTFSSVGIQARGRTTILRVNYRNTTEILRFAYDFAKDVLTPEEAEEDGIPLVQPESAGRHGEEPEVVFCSSLQEEARHIVAQFRSLHESGRKWNEMAVVYHTRFIGEEVTRALRSAGIPTEWLQESSKSKKYQPDHESVKVMTMHSSKGLEFPIVAVPGIGFLPYKDSKDDARLLYVAMTRAMERLIVSAHRQSEFAMRLLGQTQTNQYAERLGTTTGKHSPATLSA